MKASVNPDECTVCELCVDSVPEIFQLNDGVVAAITDPVPEDLIEDCKTAADDCPVDAITLTE